MTQLVGIVNLTPDSFSGDGLHNAPQKTVERMNALIADGASVIDIGAESTRPGAVLLSPEEEWRRFAPVMDVMRERAGKVGFSFDTRHAETAERILKRLGMLSLPLLSGEADFVGETEPGLRNPVREYKRVSPSPNPLPEGEGFKANPKIFVNDVSGQPPDEMAALAKAYGATLIVMHSLTVPADPKVTIPEHEDAVEVVYAWAGRMLEKYGDGIIIDPGIGFGKTAAQSLALIKNIARIRSLGAKVMIGHSRKSFLSLFTNKKAADRDLETLIISAYLVEKGVDYLRVHDVMGHAEMLRILKRLR